jgi:lipooligosaccharide transport system permease protein
MASVALPRRRASGFRLPDVTPLALHVWRRNRDVYLNVWRSEIIWPLVEPFVTLLALGVGLGGFVELDNGMDYVDFVGPALLAIFPMWTATAECGWGSYSRMGPQGTFSAIAATPVSVDEITTGEVLWAGTRSVVGVLYVGTMVLLFGGIDSPMALLIVPFAVLPGVLFASMQLSYTAIARSVSSLNYFFATFMTPQFWLSGAFFPLDEMPGWVEVVAWFTPAYHVVRPYRGLAQGDVDAVYLVDVAWIVVVMAASYLLAVHLMRRRLIK